MKKDLFGFKTQGPKYDQFRPKYPKHFLLDPLKRLKNKNRYLDIAVGTGQVLFQIASNFEQSVGVDMSQKMIEVCIKKIEQEKYPNVSVELCDFMDWHPKTKFNYITIGQALHWFEVEKTLKKIKELLQNDGLFVTYGNIFKTFRDGEGTERVEYLDLYKKFHDEMLRPHYQFDVDSLYNHYGVAKDYPFEKYFATKRHAEEVTVKMSKGDMLGLVKTFSAYNTYVEKNNEDPAIILEKGVKEDEVTVVFDFFMIVCSK